MSHTTIQDYWPETAHSCWGCGKNNIHGLQLKSHWDGDETVATWQPQAHHIAFPGVLNGGIIATLIDCHCTGTANAMAHRDMDPDTAHSIHVTKSLFVRYIRPTPVNAPVTLRARVREQDARHSVVDCELYYGDTLCAVGEVHTTSVDAQRFIGTPSESR